MASLPLQQQPKPQYGALANTMLGQQPPMAQTSMVPQTLGAAPTNGAAPGGGYTGPTFQEGQQLTAEQFPDWQNWVAAGKPGGGAAPALPGAPGAPAGPAAGPEGFTGNTVNPNTGLPGLPGITTTQVDYSGMPGVGEQGADFSGLNDVRTGLDTSGLNSLDTDFSAMGDRVRNAMFQRTSGLLNPEHERARSATASRLANQGIVEGSERWNEEMNRLDQGRAMSLERAGLDADIASGDEMGRLFQQALAARQQGVGERGLDASIGFQARGLLGGERERAADRSFSQRATARGILGGERERGADRTFNQSLGARGQLAGEMLGVRGQDVALAGQQASANAAAEGHRLSAAQAAAANDLGWARLGLDQSGQGFNQALAAGQFARQGVNMPNFGTPIPLDVTGAANVAQSGQNQQAANDAARRGGYWGLAGQLLGGNNGLFGNY